MDAQSEGRGDRCTVLHTASAQYALDVPLLADSDGTSLPVADDFATEVVLRLTVVGAVEGRQEVPLEELEDVKRRASAEQVIYVCGDNQAWTKQHSLNHFASVKCKHRALATCP
eukprot:3927562-Rhodomonas_salina.1